MPLINPVDYVYLSAYVAQVYELFANFDQDLKWVWLKPSSWIKWNFVFMRYGSLVYQSVLMYQHFHGVQVTYPPSACLPWAAMRRVFALYQRNTRVLIALLTLFISGLICTATTFSIHLLKPMNYNTTCDPLKVANRWVYFLTSLIPFCLDLLMVILTVRRVIDLTHGPRAEPMLAVILRDGTWAVFVVWVALIAAIVTSLINQLFAAYLIANSWLITTLTFTATHLVLNVRRFSEKDSRERPSNWGSSRTFDGSLTSGIALELSAFTQNRRSKPHWEVDEEANKTVSFSGFG